MTVGLAPGTLLGDRYRIVRLVAEGGMGAVYEAEQLALGRRVALKTLLPEFQDDPRLVQRFVREARATCTIAHRNVVAVLDIDQTPDGIIFFVMEYLAGADLSEVLEREGRLAWPRARELAAQVCDALEAAHERGIVHRDLKPSNCFLVGDDAGGGPLVKLLDFGVAKVLESSARGSSGGSARTVGRDLRWLKTSTGEVFGTLAYMAPEHLNGDPHDHRVDVWALGVILYEMLTGATPFSPDAPGTFVQQVLYDTPEPPSQRAPDARIPPDLDYVVLRALEKRPEDRFASMREFAEALAGVRRQAAPAIAARPLLFVPPESSAAPVRRAAPLGAAAGPRGVPVARAPGPARIGVLAGLALLGALVVVLVLRGSLAASPTVAEPAAAASSVPVPADSPVIPGGAPVPADSPVGPGGAPVPADSQSAPGAMPVPADSRSAPGPSPVLADSSAASGDAPVAAAGGAVSSPAPADSGAARPATGDAEAPAPGPSDAPAKPRARASAKSTPGGRPPPPPPPPPMNLTAADRQQLFGGYRESISRQCKRPHGLDSALVVLQITIEQARIVRAALDGRQDRARQTAARCIEKYLRAQVKVPSRFSGRATFSYAF